MTFEVELKFKLQDDSAVRRLLAELGAIASEAIPQTDRYFNHPSHDFAVTREALRVRSLGERCVVTYKGPILDKTVKTRREIELPIGVSSQEGDEFAEMLTLLGFRPVRTVHKNREPFQLCYNGVDLEIAIDSVPELGTFLEIEALADDANIASRQAIILELAGRFGLTTPERRSYLTMLLQKDEEQRTR